MSSKDCLCRLSAMFWTVTRERPMIYTHLETIQRSIIEMKYAFNKISENNLVSCFKELPGCLQKEIIMWT